MPPRPAARAGEAGARAPLVVALVACLALPAVAAGQARAQSPVGRAVFGVGASYLNSQDAVAFGFTIDGAKNFAVGEHAGLGPAGDFSFHRYEDFTVTSYLGGGRLTLGNREAQIFGQFLLGYEHYRGLNDVVLQPGVGLDIRITNLLNLRGQFDVRTVRVDTDDGRVNFTDLRAWVGVSLPF